MADPERVLVYAPRGRDGALAIQLLARHGIAATTATVDELLDGVTHAGCAVIAAESLTHAGCDRIAARLADQPPWSDFPIVLLVPRGTDRGDQTLVTARLLGNVTVLERPVQSGTLVSAVVGGLRGRRRQYAAREAIERRDQFLAMLGHELRNPLAAITLAVETLGIVTSPDEHHAILQRQTRHLNRLVDDLLDVSRVTSGKVTLRPELVDVIELLRSCVRNIEPTGGGRSIAMSVSLPEAPVVVDGDPMRLEEIFSNLLTNAIKYSPGDAQVDVTVTRDHNRCVIAIRDTGIGIAPEMLPHVFELFAQAKQSLERRHGGLGIGLTLARSLVELHGGTIDARSEGIGRGSTFTVELPCVDPPRPDAAPTPYQAPAARTTLRIVVVDDNADVLAATKLVLEYQGHRVSTASDGLTGLEEILRVQPDIAFVDIGLPGLDGYQLAATVRERSTRSPFLVAMTGYGQPQDRSRALAAGFDVHLTKPISLSILDHAIAASRCAERRGADGCT